MKVAKAMVLALSAALLAGCSSFTDVAYYGGDVKTEDGERLLGSVVVHNYSYKLLFFIPLTTGQTWQYGEYNDRAVFNMKFFSDKCTADENLKGLRHALRSFNSDRITNLKHYSDSFAWWSLFLVQQHIERTSCTVLAPR